MANYIDTLIDHGTRAGYKQHARYGTLACEPCLAADREYHRQYRRSKGVKAQKVAAHGTPSGYRRHMRQHEVPCDDCAQAQREHDRAQRQRRLKA